MAKGSPAMIALLGALAVAGYQNRDKLGAMLGSAMGTGSDPNQDPTGGSQGQEGGLLGSLRDMASNLTGGQSDKALAGLGMGGAAAGGAAGGGDLMAGLSEMFGRFSGPEHEAKALSWVGTGPNASLAPDEVEQALDARHDHRASGKDRPQPQRSSVAAQPDPARRGRSGDAGREYPGLVRARLAVSLIRKQDNGGRKAPVSSIDVCQDQ